MKYTASSSSGSPGFLPLGVFLFLALGLIACTEPIQEGGDLSSECPMSAPAPFPFKTMSSEESKARLYSEQPQEIVWPDAESFSLQAMSQELSENYVAIYDKACVAQGGQMAFPEVKAKLLSSELEYHAFGVDVDLSDSALKARAVKDKCLKSLSPNSVVSIAGVRTMGFTPNDPNFTSQKHHDFLESMAAWDVLYGSNGISAGTEVVVAIVDTGTNLTHEDLVGQLWEHPVTGKRGINYYGDFPNPDNISDDNGHGSHVAGLVAASIENAKGGAGVAPSNVKIMTVKALGGVKGQGSVEAVVNGINWARQNGAHVINLSLGISIQPAGLSSTLEHAVASGVFIAAAAGNSNQQVSSINKVFPAYYAKDLAGMMSVGSVDAHTGYKSKFSNYSSSFVEIFAPGSSASGGLFSTVGAGPGWGDYEYFEGTSMATPIVAGAAALAIGFYKEWSEAYTPALIEQHIKNSSLQSCDLWDYGQGGRYLNLKRLATEVSEAVVPGP